MSSPVAPSTAGATAESPPESKEETAATVTSASEGLAAAGEANIIELATDEISGNVLDTVAGDGLAAAHGAEVAATKAATMVNEKMFDVVDPDNKVAVQWDQILAPVSQQMRERIPGHELLMLPNQTQLVVTKRLEVGEGLADMAGISIDTPDVYAVRSVDSVTYPRGSGAS